MWQRHGRLLHNTTFSPRCIQAGQQNRWLGTLHASRRLKCLRVTRLSKRSFAEWHLQYIIHENTRQRQNAIHMVAFSYNWSFHVRQSCRVRYLFFYQWWLSMEHHVWVSKNAPGWGSVNLSQITHHPSKLGYSSREGRGRSQQPRGVILTRIILPLFLPFCSEVIYTWWVTSEYAI